MTGLVRELNADLKKIFTFKILEKSRDFVAKHHINMYIRILKYVFEIHDFKDYFHIFILKQEF